MCSSFGAVGFWFRQTMVRLAYTTGSGIQFFEFSSVDELKQWESVVLQIKHEADSIHQKRQAGITNGDERDYSAWIATVLDFAGRYGKEYVPPDIRSALNSVQTELGLPATEW